MRRKDCEQHRPTGARCGAPWRAVGVRVLAVVLVPGMYRDAQAGAVRLWPTAVVVSDAIHLDDVCALHGFDADSEARLAKTVITPSPTPGGSRIVHLEMIRSALAAQGVSMADVTFGGAVRCAVTRPATLRADRPETATGQRHNAANDRATTSASSHVAGSGRRADASPAHDSSDGDSPDRPTLREAVIKHFSAETARYHAEAEVVLDRTDEQVLNLSGPDYTFHVRTRGDARLGLVPVEVDVLSRDRIVQTVPLVVQVSMSRPTVVARRTINQEATIRSADVEVIPLRYAALTRLGIDDPQRVIGQRAKRLIRAGTTIGFEMLERVPLVVRGQLVSVASVAGGVRVVTSGKAAADGHLGEVITVRPTDRRRVQLDATVVGPGRVQLGGRRPRPQPPNADEGRGL